MFQLLCISAAKLAVCEHKSRKRRCWPPVAGELKPQLEPARGTVSGSAWRPSRSTVRAPPWRNSAAGCGAKRRWRSHLWLMQQCRSGMRMHHMRRTVDMATRWKPVNPKCECHSAAACVEMHVTEQSVCFLLDNANALIVEAGQSARSASASLLRWRQIRQRSLMTHNQTATQQVRHACHAIPASQFGSGLSGGRTTIQESVR